MDSYNYSPVYHVNSENVFDELRKYILADGFNLVIDLDKSEDGMLVDSLSKSSFLDLFTFFASNPVGMNHPKMMDTNFINYIGRKSLNKPSNSDIFTEEMATFVKTFFKVAVPDYFKYSFYIEGGALAVENALKTAFDWKVRQNFKKGYQSEKGHKILHFKEAFHGRSGYTMSLTNTDPIKTMYYPKFEWPRVLNPKIKFPLNDFNLSDVIKREQQSIEEIKNAFLMNKDDIAAIIIEVIQGEGGDNHFRTEFIKQLRILADENDALLIFDEVQTGLGLTGKMWAHQYHDVQPDIMSFGKKTQVCGILVGDKIDSVEENVFKMSSRINSTWGGNFVDMIRATKYLEIIEEENLVSNASEMGEVLQLEIENLENQYPEILSNSRGKGLFRAFDFISKEKRNEFIKECFNEKLMILPCGSTSVRFRPALNVKKYEIMQGIEIINSCIKKIVKNLHKIKKI